MGLPRKCPYKPIYIYACKLCMLDVSGIFLGKLMHQSFATTSPSGPGNSGDIDFSLSKARVNAQHCRDTLMVKALPKSTLKSRQVNVNFHGHFGTGIKTPAISRHCGDNAEVKTLQLSPAMPQLFPDPRGPWLQTTGALYGCLTWFVCDSVWYGWC